MERFQFDLSSAKRHCTVSARTSTAPESSTPQFTMNGLPGSSTWPTEPSHNTRYLKFENDPLFKFPTVAYLKLDCALGAATALGVSIVPDSSHHAFSDSGDVVVLRAPQSSFQDSVAGNTVSSSGSEKEPQATRQSADFNTSSLSSISYLNPANLSDLELSRRFSLQLNRVPFTERTSSDEEMNDLGEEGSLQPVLRPSTSTATKTINFNSAPPKPSRALTKLQPKVVEESVLDLPSSFMLPKDTKHVVHTNIALCSHRTGASMETLNSFMCVGYLTAGALEFSAALTKSCIPPSAHITTLLSAPIAE